MSHFVNATLGLISCRQIPESLHLLRTRERRLRFLFLLIEFIGECRKSWRSISRPLHSRLLLRLALQLNLHVLQTFAVALILKDCLKKRLFLISVHTAIPVNHLVLLSLLQQCSQSSHLLFEFRLSAFRDTVAPRGCTSIVLYTLSSNLCTQSSHHSVVIA